MSVTVRVPMEQFAKVMDQFPKYSDDYLRAVGNRLRKLLPGTIQSMLGPYSKGRLARSARAYVSRKGVEIQIGEGVEHAPYVFGGVGLHTMDQKAAGKTWPMRWTHAGGSGVAWKVKHPGQRARQDILDVIRALAVQVALEEFVIFEAMGVT